MSDEKDKDDNFIEQFAKLTEALEARGALFTWTGNGTDFMKIVEANRERRENGYKGYDRTDLMCVPSSELRGGLIRVLDECHRIMLELSERKEFGVTDEDAQKYLDWIDADRKELWRIKESVEGYGMSLYKAQKSLRGTLYFAKQKCSRGDCPEPVISEIYSHPDWKQMFYCRKHCSEIGKEREGVSDAEGVDDKRVG